MRIGRFVTRWLVGVAFGAIACGISPPPAAGGAIPAILGDWWQIAGNPEVTPYTNAGQEPVDFAIWQAANGSWQLWSCIRQTSYPGHTRLFHGWESSSLFNSNWTAKGITMTSNTSLGEALGGLQAPYVFREGATFHMLYGTWDHIARATSSDGRNFSRVIQPSGKTSLFGDGETIPRDPMVIKLAGTYYAYYTASTNNEGKVYLRTSADLNHWSDAQVVAFGGASSGTGAYSAECPFVYYDAASEAYYLFRTQQYGANARTSVYRSNNPTYFGIGDDANNYYVGSLPVAAPEVFDFGGKTYMAALNPGLNGIRVAEFGFVTPPEASPIFTGGGAWDVTERRINTTVPGSFAIGSVEAADALLALAANDQRILFDRSVKLSAINFNHATGDVGQFANDSPFLGGSAGNDIAVRVAGDFQLDVSGTITFGVTVNDGARLRVDGQTVVLDNSSNAVSNNFGSLQLAAGRHELELVYFQRNYGAVLELYMANEVGEFAEFAGGSAPSNYWSLLEAAPLPGDYDRDWDVDSDDYSAWKASFGAIGRQLADGNADGTVDAADYVIWRDHTTLLAAGNAVQAAEPTYMPLVAALTVAFVLSDWR